MKRTLTILMLLKAKDSDEKAFFVYDAANQTFSSSIPVSVSDYLEKSVEYKELKQFKEDTENAPNVLAIVLGVVLAASVAFNGYLIYSIYKNKETAFKFLKK